MMDTNVVETKPITFEEILQLVDMDAASKTKEAMDGMYAASKTREEMDGMYVYQASLILCYAAEVNAEDVVRMLLKEKNIMPNLKNNYALRIAAAKGHTEIIKLLKLDNRVDYKVLEDENLKIKIDNLNNEKFKRHLENKYINPFLKKLDKMKENKSDDIFGEALQENAEVTIGNQMPENSIDDIESDNMADEDILVEDVEKGIDLLTNDTIKETAEDLSDYDAAKESSDTEDADISVDSTDDAQDKSENTKSNTGKVVNGLRYRSYEDAQSENEATMKNAAESLKAIFSNINTSQK